MKDFEINQQISRTIMEQSRHQFIYGYNSPNREKFLKQLELNYPFTLDKSNPIALYLDNVGLAKTNKSIEGLDKVAMTAFNNHYLEFEIASKMVGSTLEQIDGKELDKRQGELLERINYLCLSKKDPKIKSLKELKNILTEVKHAYYYEYSKYVESGILENFIVELPLSYLGLSMFMTYYKRMLNTNSYFGIVIDNKNPISIRSQQAINGLIGSRINSDLSIKVACEPSEWETYYDLNGTLVERIHDYGVVELDNSNNEYIKKLKRKYEI